MNPKKQKLVAKVVASRTAEVEDYCRRVTDFVASRDPSPEPTRTGGLVAAPPDRLLWLADALASRKPPPWKEFARIVDEIARAITMDPPCAPGCHRCGARVDSGAQIAGLLRPLRAPPRPEIAHAFMDEAMGRWWLRGRLCEAASRLAGYCTDRCAVAHGEQVLRQEQDASEAQREASMARA